MAVREKKKYWLALALIFFVIYLFTAARPIPPETILIPRWLSSLESDYPVMLAGGETGNGGEIPSLSGILPFQLGDRFGYVDAGGRFILNRVKKNNLSLSAAYWAEYEAVPQKIDIRGPFDDALVSIEQGRGYPFFLDGRLFLVGPDRNSITALDDQGRSLWTYDFAAILTCADAAAGFLLTGSLDGRVELLDDKGKLVSPPFEPGGSRLAVILGCALSQDGSRIAIVSGVDDQRFLLLERSARTPGGGTGESYRVIYHEFLHGGFKRGVQVAFIDNDNRVAFEREGGLGIYDINSRTSVKLPLKGEIIGFDGTGGDQLFFVITSQSDREKRLVAVRLPGTVVIEAPFKSGTAFLGRKDSRIYVGGGMTLASFELGKK